MNDNEAVEELIRAVTEISDRCPGCQLRMSGPRQVVENAVKDHRRVCSSFRAWEVDQMLLREKLARSAPKESE
jgi:hypothetical protein